MRPDKFLCGMWAAMFRPRTRPPRNQRQRERFDRGFEFGLSCLWLVGRSARLVLFGIVVGVVIFWAIVANRVADRGAECVRKIEQAYVG